MLRIIVGAQALSAVKGGNHATQGQQYHIHYAHPQHDRRFVSDQTEALLREVMRQAGVNVIWITSTVRDAREQAATMLHNLEAENDLQDQLAGETDPAHRKALSQLIKARHVGYAAPGTKVLNVASGGIDAGEDDEVIIAEMIKTIEKVGLAKVTKHAAVSGRNTVDISHTQILKTYGKAGYNSFVEAVTSFVFQGRIARFGWREGPVGNGVLFHDGACFHIEIDQRKPVLYA